MKLLFQNLAAGMTKTNKMKANTRMKLAIGVAFTLGLLGQAALLAGDDLTARYELTLDRVVHGGPPVFTDDFVLADAVPQHVRRFTEFSGDVSGRYIGALAVAEQFSGKNFPELDRVVGKLVKLQQADGHFGDPFRMVAGDFQLADNFDDRQQ